jgi:hypothetical protein
MWTRADCQIPVVAFCLFWITTAFVIAAPPNPEFAAAKQLFMKEMKKKAPAARAAAVTTLAEVVLPETADLLLKRGISDPEISVRIATQNRLRELANDETVQQFLFDELKKSFRKPPANDSNAIELLRALVPTEYESQQSDLLKILDEFLASPKAHLLVPMTVIDDYGTQGDAESFRSVALLAQTKTFQDNFGYRRCVVQAMSQIRQPEAIEFLIDLLPKTQGLIQYDVIQYLTRLTAQKFRDNERDWTNWWIENKAIFKFLPAGKALPDAPLDLQKSSYYGIPICAKRVVFVLDTSASMRGLPIESAKQALVKSIESLPEEVAFNVVFFDAAATAWHGRLVPASAEAKQNATQAVAERGLKLGTASSAALNAAFALEPEAIYFVSDGEPTDGTPAQIVSSASQFNRTRRVSIHTIGVVTQRNGGAGLTLFMQPLAEQNYGKFQLIE